MKTDEIIRAIRIWAEQIPMPGRHRLLIEAADRLEELDERVAIMSESKTGKWIGIGECTVCGFDWSSVTYDVTEQMAHMSYCPACGARMEGAE